MKIRKSRLKEIIKEEVESSKFIPISETDEPTIMAPGIGNLGQDAMAVLRQVQTFINKMIEDDEVYGSLVDSALSRLQGIATFHRELRPHVNEAEPTNALLDEIVVQEIVKALSSVNEDEETDEAAEEESEADAQLASNLEEHQEEEEKIDAPKGLANLAYAKSIAAFRKKQHAEDPDLKHRVMEEGN